MLISPLSRASGSVLRLRSPDLFLIAWTPGDGGAVEAAETGASEGLRPFLTKDCFLGGFVEADLASHHLSRLRSLQRHVGTNSLMPFSPPPPLPPPNETSSLAARPTLYRRHFTHRRENETTPKPSSADGAPKRPREKGFVLRGGRLSAPGWKAPAFFGVFSLRVIRGGFTFGLNFCSHLPQRRLFTTCLLVSISSSSSPRGARR